MSDTQTLVLVSVLRDMVLLTVFLWLPVMNKERAFFGVRVDPELYRGEGRQTLHRYWLTLIGVFGLSEAVGFFLFVRLNNPILSALVSLVATGGAFASYSIYARGVYPHAITSGATRFASSIQARSSGSRKTGRVWLYAQPGAPAHPFAPGTTRRSANLCRLGIAEFLKNGE